MTIVIMDGFPGPLPPYLDWLAGTAADVVLLTGRSTGEVAAGNTGGYAEVRSIPGYSTSAEVELAVLELARRTAVSAIVATGTADLIRAGALRDHLGLTGQGRAAAALLSDPVAMRELLNDNGIATVTSGIVQRPADLYWYACRWGYPVHVRRRRAAGWPAVTVLHDEAEVTAFTKGTFSADLQAVPSLIAEAFVAGERHRINSETVTAQGSQRSTLAAKVLAALPVWPGQRYVVDLIHTADGEWLVDTVGPGVLTADAVRVQAGLASNVREVA